MADAKAILIANWDATITSMGMCEWDKDVPKRFCFDGVILDRAITTNLAPGGLSHQQTDSFGGDSIMLFVYAETDELVQLKINALVKEQVTFLGDTTYTKLYLDLLSIGRNIPREDSPLLPYRCSAEVPALFTKNNRSIYT